MLNAGIEAGSTAVVVFMRDDQLWVAHTGDSRALIASKKTTMALTEDHHPDAPQELER